MYYIQTSKELEQSIKQLFIDFIRNRSNTAEIEKVHALIKSGGYAREWEEATKETADYFIQTDQSHLYINEEKIFSKIEESIKMASTPTRHAPWGWIALAASLLLTCATAIWFNRIQEPIATKQVKIEKPKPILRKESHKWVKLPDGSSVQLNNNSNLDYPDSFEGKSKREVFLVGEAFFDIKHDAAHPFIIHTGKIKTTVLGTAFNISAYDANSAVTVTVTRGKVKVEDEKHTLAVLTPDQQLAWNIKKESPVTIAKVNAIAVVEWKSQDLIMDDISLAEAAGLISARYGVKIKFNNDHVKSCRFTAAFLNRNEISQVLSVIEDITGAKLTLKNNQITIDGPGC